MAGANMMDMPFIGSYYSKSSGLIQSNDTQNQKLLSIEVKPAELTIYVSMEDLTGQLNEDHTHIVVGTRTEAECFDKDKLNINFLWNKIDPSLSVNLKCGQKSVAISQFDIMPVNDFLDQMGENKCILPIQLTCDDLLDLFVDAKTFFTEVSQFSEFVQKSLTPYTTKKQRKKVSMILHFKSTEFAKILTILYEFTPSSWVTYADTITKAVATVHAQLASHMQEYKKTKSAIVEKARFAKQMINDGVLYIGSGDSLLQNLNSDKDKKYYVLFFCEDFITAKTGHVFQSTCNYFKTLLQSHKHLGDISFIVVDLDLHNEKLPFNRPTQAVITFFHGSQCLSNDVHKDLRNTSNYAKCIHGDLKVGKPTKRAFLKMPCPGSLLKGCSNEIIEWVCSECKSPILYGFDNSFFCDCGKAPTTNLGFRCSDRKHGYDFDKFETGLLKSYLNNLTPIKEINLLLLGETGVGKSTWINGIVNYMKYSTLKEAESNNIIATVPAKFTVMNDNMKPEIISVGHDENEDVKLGNSSTQDCRTYVVPYKNMVINMIDTPGIGDVRGIEQDKQNLKKILDYIRHSKQIHGICILLKPNQSRLHVLFRFCVIELLTHLHKSAAQNLLFCFTNSRSTFYRPGETLPVLRNLLDNLKMDYSLNKERIYCLDNESFRFLCTLRKRNISYSEEDRNSFIESWDRSVQETRRLLDFIFTLSPHEVEETMTLNNARRIVLSLTQPLADITQNIEENVAIINDYRNRIRNWSQSDKELTSLRIPQINLVCVEIQFPRTVCTNSSCVKQVKSPYSNRTQTQYVKHCHPHCYLQNVIPETYPTKELINCAAMRGERCKHCGCGWEKHMHIRYDQVRQEVLVQDEGATTLINSKQSLRDKQDVLLTQAQDRITKLNREKTEIMKISVKFGHFLKVHAITPYNDAMKDYLMYLIQQEKSKADKSEIDRSIIQQLEAAIRTYEEEKRILESAMASNRNDTYFTAQDIDKWTKDLYNLPINGEQLRRTMEIALSSQNNCLQSGYRYANKQPPINSKQFVYDDANRHQKNDHRRGRGRGRGGRR